MPGSELGYSKVFGTDAMRKAYSGLFGVDLTDDLVLRRCFNA